MVINDLKNHVRKMLSLRDTELLITEALSLSITEYALDGKRSVSDTDFHNIIKMAERIKKGEPLQYVTGMTEFMSLKFTVNNNVLIPRPDTETLAEKALSLMAGKKNVRLLDIGTGSGCVGISIGKLFPDSEITLLDISSEALKIAEKNAALNNVDVNILKCDILNEIPTGKFDIIVSNPPYIRTSDIIELDTNVRDYEPHTALDGGDDGLLFYRRITEIAKAILNVGGALAYEVGFDQADDVSDIMSAFANVEKTKDLCGIERVVSGIFV